MKLSAFKFVCFCSLLLSTGCSAKSSLKGFIVLNRCYKLIKEHYTETKPEQLNLDTLKEWEQCETNLFDYEKTRINASSADKTLSLSLVKNGDDNVDSFVCNYELLVDNVGQSGTGYILINGEKFNFYLIDTWALCIDVSGNLIEGKDARTLEYQLWGC